MRSAELGWATYGEDASVNRLQERVARAARQGGGALGADVRDGEPRRADHARAARHRGRARVAVARPHVGGDGDHGHRRPRAALAVGGRRPARPRGGGGARRRRAGVAARAREHAHARGRHGALAGADGGARARGAPERRQRPPRRRPARERRGRARRAARRARGARRHGRAQPQQGALRAVRGRSSPAARSRSSGARRNLRRLGGGVGAQGGNPRGGRRSSRSTRWSTASRDDHRRARELGALLAAIPGLRLEPEVVETNIVLVDVGATGLAPEELLPLLAERGVLAMQRDTSRIRFVTHRLIGDAEVARAADVVAEVVAEHAPQV